MYYNYIKLQILLVQHVSAQLGHHQISFCSVYVRVTLGIMCYF